MFILKSVDDLETVIQKQRQSGKTIGFVPTMGALHMGHISLIQHSRSQNNITVCSIFINPLQFNDQNDLIHYPRQIEKDILLLAEHGADILFLPGVEDIYPNGEKGNFIDLKNLDEVFEGHLRPGHFQGVAIVVKRLFECVKPDRAYFGQKDFQQTLVIRELVRQLNLSVEIVISDIVREENGLAMSSRNMRLDYEKREKAGLLYQVLMHLKDNSGKMPLKDALEFARNELTGIDNLSIEYLEVVDPDNLNILQDISGKHPAIAIAAVKYNGVRLLDNEYI